jgi:delta 1-pyrroline-5-carboxylate dehydrogenase
LSRKEQKDYLLSQIKDAVSKGATVLYGGKTLNGKGYFIEPTVLINVNHEMKLMTEESFGPVVGIQKVKDDTEAARLMLNSEYGLTAAVYSKSYERAEEVMKQMNTERYIGISATGLVLLYPGRGEKFRIGQHLILPGHPCFVQPAFISWIMIPFSPATTEIKLQLH